MLLVLAGGIGAAKLVRGISAAGLSKELSVIVNTGDDETFYGLAICPDLDSITYALAKISNSEVGWGVANETFSAMAMLKTLGDDAWFNLGDKDLGTHLYRTKRLLEGASLSQVVDEISIAHDIDVKIYPMANSNVRTTLEARTFSDSAPDECRRVSFQEYFVKYRAQPELLSVSYEGAERASVPAEVLDAIADADRIIIAPSNPILSIGPILSITPIAQAIRSRRRDVLAVSPVVRDKAFKGPTAQNMRSILGSSSVYEVAKFYQPFASRIIIDPQDIAHSQQIAELGLEVSITDLAMADSAAEVVLGLYCANR